jgi:hypothetical protein
MVLMIPLEQTSISPTWRIHNLHSLSIDYADSTLRGWFKNSDDEVIVCRLKDYGMTLSNIRNGYELSWGPAGIYVKITCPTKNSGEE